MRMPIRVTKMGTRMRRRRRRPKKRIRAKATAESDTDSTSDDDAGEDGNRRGGSGGGAGRSYAAASDEMKQLAATFKPWICGLRTLSLRDQHNRSHGHA